MTDIDRRCSKGPHCREICSLDTELFEKGTPAKLLTKPETERSQKLRNAARMEIKRERQRKIFSRYMFEKS